MNCQAALTYGRKLKRDRSRKLKMRVRGFTLIENAMASALIGVSVLAVMSAQQAFHQQNDEAGQIGTALSLANEIREVTLGLPLIDPMTGNLTWGPESNEGNGTPNDNVANYDDLDDFGGSNGTGATFNPPINALRQPIPNMTGWSQLVTIETVDPDDISGPNTNNNQSNHPYRITVRVMYQKPSDEQAREITQLSWVTGGE